MTFSEIGIYACLWLSFGVVHSLLASQSAKRYFAPLLGSGYRLGYNLFAALHIALIIIGGHIVLGAASAPLDWPTGADTALIVVRWAGIAIIMVALTQYDLGQFSGLAQLRRKHLDEERLHISGMHRYIRHPLYLGAHLYLWGGAQDEFGLQTALWGSIYLVIGTWFEERRLLTQFGPAYAVYKASVPMLLPTRGRAI